MDPVSAIIGALVAGASAALSDTANQAVKDSYAGLKQILQDTYSFISIRLLEKQPDNETFRQAAEDELKQSKALDNQEVIRQALAILTAAVDETAGQSKGLYGVDVETMKAGRNILIERVSGRDGGVAVGHMQATEDITLRDIKGGGGKKQTG